MAEQYDGDIKLAVTLDASNVRQQAEQLRGVINQMLEGLGNIPISPNLQRILDTLRQSAEYSEQLAQDLMIAGEQMSQVADNASEAADNTGGMTEDLVDAANQTQEATQELINQVAENNNDMRAGIDEATQELGNFGDEEMQVIRQAQILRQQIGNVFTTAMNRTRQMVQRFRQLAAQIARTGVALLKSGLTRLGSIFFGGARGEDSFTQKLRKGITTVLGYAVGIASLAALFGKLKSAATEAFQRMAKQIPEVNRSMSMLASAIQNLKNSIGTALQPILTAIAPVLSKIINLFAQAATKVGEFFAALTGQKYVYKATAANIDYAKSLDKTTKSQKKQKEETEKALGAYDKLLVIQKKQKDETPDDPGGTYDPEAAKGSYQKVPIDPKMAKLVDWLKDMWRKADFSELGRLLSEKLANMLDRIPWAKIKAAAARLGKSLGTFLTSIWQNLHLADSLGRTIGEIFNTGLEFAYAFAESHSLKDFGRFIGTLISSALRTAEWDKLKKLGSMIGEDIADGVNAFLRTDALVQIGGAIGNLIRAIVNLAWKAVTGIEWDKLGKRLRQGLNAMLNRMLEVDEDGKSGFTKLGETISALISGVFTAINEVLGDAYTRKKIGKAITEFLNGIDFVSLLSGLQEMIINVGKLFLEVISSALKSDTLRQGLIQFGPKLALIIGTIFTVNLLHAVGQQVAIGFARGLGQGILESLVAGGTIEGITASLGGLTSTLASVASAISGLIVPIGLVIAAIAVWVHNWDDIKEAAGLFVERTIEHWNDLKSWFETNMPNFSELVKTAFTPVFEYIDGRIIDAKEKLEAFKKFMTGFLEGLKVGISTGLELIKTSVSEKVEAVKGFVRNGLTFLKETVEAVSGGILSVIRGDLQGVWQAFVNVFTAIRNFVLGIINDARNWGVNLVSNIKNGITGGGNIVTSSGFGTGFKQGLINYVKGKFGFANGAVIPPNKEFLAVLGDQKNGTNIETPLSTMVEAFKGAINEMGGAGGGNQAPILLQLDGRTVAQVVWDEQKKRYAQTGQYSPRMV